MSGSVLFYAIKYKEYYWSRSNTTAADLGTWSKDIKKARLYASEQIAKNVTAKQLSYYAHNVSEFSLSRIVKIKMKEVA